MFKMLPLISERVIFIKIKCKLQTKTGRNEKKIIDQYEKK